MLTAAQIRCIAERAVGDMGDIFYDHKPECGETEPEDAAVDCVEAAIIEALSLIAGEATLLATRGWLVNNSVDDKYVYIQLDGSPGQITVKSEAEGFVVDIWSDDLEVVATAAAMYTELEAE